MNYAYQAEQLSIARYALMLPHIQGFEFSIAHAFHECHKAFHDLDTSALDDNAQIWINKIKEFMDISNITDNSVKGTWAIKALSLTTDQQIELSRSIDKLAHWFDRKAWAEG